MRACAQWKRLCFDMLTNEADFCHAQAAVEIHFVTGSKLLGTRACATFFFYCLNHETARLLMKPEVLMVTVP